MTNENDKIFRYKIFLFFAVYLIPVLCCFRASIIIHKSRLSQKRKFSQSEVQIQNYSLHGILFQLVSGNSTDYHQQQEQSKKQNMIRYMVIILQIRDL